MKRKGVYLSLGFLLLGAIALASWFLGSYLPKRYGIYEVEYILWAIVIGILIRNTAFRKGVPKTVGGALGTYEFWIKTGLVLLGGKLNFAIITEAGIRGLAYVAVCIPAAVLLVHWLGRRYRLTEKFSAVLATGLAICGVSAALSAGAAIKADRKHIQYVVALLLIFGAPLLFLYPVIGYALNMPPEIYGAWTGGSIDNTAQAVATGYIYGERAGDIATVTKYCYNALIGLVAFLWAVYYAAKEAWTGGERVSPIVIWTRFPKFIIGFLLLATLNTLGVFTNTHISAMKNLYKWFFALTFAGVGLETSLEDFRKVGGGPFYIMIIATVFLSVLALVLAYLVW